VAAIGLPRAVLAETWTNPAGGDWSVAGNWSGNQPPNASIEAQFNLGSGSGYTAMLSADSSAADVLVKGDNVTIDLGSHRLNNSSSSLSISGASGFTNTLTVQNGMLGAFGGIPFGGTGTFTLKNVSANPSHGDLNISGDASSTITLTNDTLAGGLQNLDIGGSGTINGTGITGFSNARLVIGGSGTTTLSGSFSTASSAEDVVIGNGTGATTVSGSATADGYVRIGAAPTATVTAPTKPPTLVTSNDVGTLNGSASGTDGILVGVNGGNGTLNAGASNTITNTAGYFYVGFGGTGVVNASAGAHLTTKFTDIGVNSGGNGTVSLSGAGTAWSTPAGQAVIGTSGGTGSVSLSNGATWSVAVDFFGNGNGSIEVGGGGTLSIGAGSSVSAASLLQDAGGDLAFTLAGPAPSQFGKLTTTNALTLAGQLDVTTSGGFIPAADQSFDLMDFGSESGTFSTIHLPTLPVGETWNTSQLYSAGIISVVPEPASTMLVFGCAWLACAARRQKNAKHRGWNAMSLLAGWQNLQ
jgi:T5SS/PEP-CTERM-associated repeat protein